MRDVEYVQVSEEVQGTESYKIWKKCKTRKRYKVQGALVELLYQMLLHLNTFRPHMMTVLP